MRITTLLVGTMLASQAWAMEEPKPLDDAEPRIRTVEYRTNEIYRIRVPAGSETQVVLSEAERGQGNIVVSRAQEPWRFVPAGNTVIFAAKPGATTTYAHIVSRLPDDTLRRYTLQLETAENPASTNVLVASADGGVPAVKATPSAGFAVVNFTYAADDAARSAANKKKEAAAKAQEVRVQRTTFRQGQGATVQNAFGPPIVKMKAPPEERKRCDFLYRGATTLWPQAVCDRGNRTTFLWSGQVSVPAIFAVDSAGHPHRVNAAPNPLVEGEIVVPQTSQRWIIVYGKDRVLELWNDGYDPYWTPSAARMAMR